MLCPMAFFRYNNKFYKVDDILFNETPRSTFFDAREGKDVSMKNH